MTSTLVETVSINYDDFNESFLTCGTCLCTYDTTVHLPKLLSCSHTICLDCLSRIVASNTKQPGELRCPICRATVQLPDGGVSALPPSFVVNQLLDLMSRQRKDIVPRCSIHQGEDLLFCETCDNVFCSLCTKTPTAAATTSSSSSCCSTADTLGSDSGGRHPDTTPQCSGHTVVPFNVAVRRISEILLYKANECNVMLNKYKQSVTVEMDELSANSATIQRQINASFDQLQSSVNSRRAHLLSQLEEISAAKHRVLTQQLEAISSEQTRVRDVCEDLRFQVHVHNMTRKVVDLNERLEAVAHLNAPCENSFVHYEANGGRDSGDRATSTSVDIQSLQTMIGNCGRVRTSHTNPAASVLEPFSAAAHLLTSVTLSTFDFSGRACDTGGDSVHVTLTDAHSCQLPVTVCDLHNGRYQLQFRTHTPGRHSLCVHVLGRPIPTSPLVFDVTSHNDPVRVIDAQLRQPTALTVCASTGRLYVSDTGNCRISVFSAHPHLELVQQIVGCGLSLAACTGLVCDPVTGHLFVTNWRSRTVCEVDATDGTLVHQFTHETLHAPVALALTSQPSAIVVADVCVHVFGRRGEYVREIGRGRVQNVTAVTATCDSHLIVADTHLWMFSLTGELLRRFIAPSESKGPGYYGGLVCDTHGNLLTTRSDKSRHYIQVFSIDSGNLLFWIDSDKCRLRRPAGLLCFDDGCVLVCDLGNDCMKLYRYL